MRTKTGKSEPISEPILYNTLGKSVPILYDTRTPIYVMSQAHI
jgi:hypothetical protein